MTKPAGVSLPDPKDKPTLPVWPDTGRIFGLSKASTYEAVRRGEIPVIRFGRRLVVPTAALHKMLQISPSEAA